MTFDDIDEKVVVKHNLGTKKVITISKTLKSRKKENTSIHSYGLIEEEFKIAPYKERIIISRSYLTMPMDVETLTGQKIKSYVLIIYITDITQGLVTCILLTRY